MTPEQFINRWRDNPLTERAGAQAQIQILAQTDIPRIVYVSCSPQTFARDAAILVQCGYKLEKLTIVDQFIWSPHTEIVGVFS